MNSNELLAEHGEPVRDLTRRVVARVASDEAPFFDVMFDQYLLALASSPVEATDGAGEGLGLTGPVIAGVPISGETIAAVVLALVKLATVLASRAKPKGASKPILPPVPPDDELSIREVQEMLYRRLRERRIGHERAHEISVAFAQELLNDPPLLRRLSS